MRGTSGMPLTASPRRGRRKKLDRHGRCRPKQKTTPRQRLAKIVRSSAPPNETEGQRLAGGLSHMKRNGRNWTDVGDWIEGSPCDDGKYTEDEMQTYAQAHARKASRLEFRSAWPVREWRRQDEWSTHVADAGRDRGILSRSATAVERRQPASVRH